MGETSRKIKVPSAEQIVEINYRMIESKGGTFIRPQNLRYRHSLDWVLGAIQHPVLFGEDLYPTLWDKASLIAWIIITRHVFTDGNKRTGMAAAQVFLELNGHFLYVSDEEMEEVALRIVAHRENGFSRPQLSTWMSYHSGPSSTG